MKEISGSEALQILSRNGPECMIASDTLGYLCQSLQKGPGHRKCPRQCVCQVRT